MTLRPSASLTTGGLVRDLVAEFHALAAGAALDGVDIDDGDVEGVTERCRERAAQAVLLPCFPAPSSDEKRPIRSLLCGVKQLAQN